MSDRNKIFLIDDDVTNTFLTQFQLNKVIDDSQFELICYSSANEALKSICKGERPILSVLDLNTPGLDGWEYLKKTNRLRGRF